MHKKLKSTRLGSLGLLALACFATYGMADCDSPTFIDGGTLNSEFGENPDGAALDSSGNLFLLSHMHSTPAGQMIDIDPTAGTDLRTPHEDGHVLVCRINADGSYAWGHTIGRDAGAATSYESARAITVDDQGGIYIVGYCSGAFATVDFDPTAGVDEHTVIEDDIFVTKLNDDGTYGWTYVASAFADQIANDVAIDSKGNIVVIGDFEGVVDFDPGPGEATRATNGGLDIFVLRLHPDGSFDAVTTFGGTDWDTSHNIALDGQDNVYLEGRFVGTVDFDPGPGVDEHSALEGGLPPYQDRFLSRWDSAWNYQWTRTCGDPHYDFNQSGLAVTDDAAYVAGEFDATRDFDPGPGVDKRTPAGQWDAYIWKINADGSYGWTVTIGLVNSRCQGRDIALGPDGDVLVTGMYSGLMDFDPGEGTDLFFTGGDFVTRLGSDGTYRWTVANNQISLVEMAWVAKIAANQRGDIAVTGRAQAAGMAIGTFDVDPTSGVLQFPTGDECCSNDVFFTRLSCPVDCPADIDGSGDVGFTDLLAVLTQWGACPGCPEDIDGDGTVGFTDLLAVLSDWGPCV